MFKTTLTAMLFVLSVSHAAFAGGQAGTLGLGAEAQLSGLGGIDVDYDGGKFHFGGFLGYDRISVMAGMATNTASVLELGGHFYYHLHSTAMADLGLGAGISLASVPNGGNNRNTLLFLEPGFQIRVFLASNVALSFAGGLALGVLDADSVAITGQIVGGNGFVVGGLTLGLVGGAGVTYFFF